MPDPAPRFVTVVCRVCETRLDEEAAPEARESICPICHSLVIIPAAGQAVVKKGPVFQTDPNLEGYSLLPSSGPQAEEQAKRAQDVVLVVCPVCRARLHARPKKEAYHIECHDCRESVRVPSRAEHRAREKRDAIPKPEMNIEPVPVGQVVASDRVYSGWYLKAQGEIRREADPRPPRSVFFSSTFTFPWEPDILMRWVYLSGGLTFFAMVAAVMATLLGDGAAPSTLAIAFFALPLVWIAIWTVSYAASLSMAIVTDTANGNQKIINWAEQNWREWVITMAYVQYLIAVAALAGYVARVATQALDGPADAVFVGVTAIAFPYVVLSALESGGGLNFVSANVTLTLIRKPLWWVGYYLLAGALTAAVAGAVWGLWQVHPYLAGGLGGVVLAAFLLVQARLLGRLAWAISRE
jgi:hypothetical protein